MGRAEDLSKKNQGVYQWTSEVDQDGDIVRAQNLRGFQGVMILTGKPSKLTAGLMNPADAREFALAILDLLEGGMPRKLHHRIDTETGETQ